MCQHQLSPVFVTCTNVEGALNTIVSSESNENETSNQRIQGIIQDIKSRICDAHIEASVALVIPKI